MDTTILIDILKDEVRSFRDKLYMALLRGEVYACVPALGSDLRFLEHGGLKCR